MTTIKFPDQVDADMNRKADISLPIVYYPDSKEFRFGFFEVDGYYYYQHGEHTSGGYISFSNCFQDLIYKAAVQSQENKIYAQKYFEIAALLRSIVK